MPLFRHIYECRIELHDPVFFATREIGGLYETAPHLHNYALSYALGLVCSPYHSATQIPRYQEDLESLNDAGIYVFPAMAIRHSGTTDTWSFARTEGYFKKRPSQDDTRRNIPLIGRNKQLDIGSEFIFFVMSLNPIALPRWIRLGKVASKARLTAILHHSEMESGAFLCSHPCNGLDLLGSGYIPKGMNVVNMPPVSLAKNVHSSGPYFRVGEVCLPNLEYCFHD